MRASVRSTYPLLHRLPRHQPSPPAAAEPTRWRDAVNEAIRAALFLILAINAIAVLAIGSRYLNPLTPLGWTGAALLAAAYVVMIRANWTRRTTRTTSATVLALETLGLVFLTPLTKDGPGLADSWWPMPLLVATLTYIAIARRRTGWLFAAALIAINLILRLDHWQAAPDLTHLTRLVAVSSETVHLIGVALTAYLAASLTRRAARAADAAQALDRSAQIIAHTSRRDAVQAQEADRVVHDQVLHGLRTIALDRSVVPASAAVAAARAMLDLLEGPSRRPPPASPPPPSSYAVPGPDPLPTTARGEPLFEEAEPLSTGLADRLEALAADLPLRVTVRAPRGLDLPAYVEDALCAASREALRNVVKHSGVHAARVEVTLGRLSVTVQISDDGRGFAQPARYGREGVASSILRRMTDVGGDATVSSRPGRGTVVSLTWTPIPSQNFEPARIAGGAANRLLPSAAVVVAPLLIVNVWNAAFLASSLRFPTLVAGLGLLVSAVGALVTWRALLGGGVTIVESGAVTLVAWVAAVGGSMALPLAGTHPRLVWLLTGASLLAATLSLFRPLREAIVCGTGTAVLGVAGIMLRGLVGPGAGTGLHLQTDLLAYVPHLLTPVLTLAVGIVVRLTIDRFTWQILRSEESMAEAAAALDDDASLRTHVHARLRHRRRVLTDVLDAILADPASVETHATQIRADRLERELRDALHVNHRGPVPIEIISLRESGWEATARVTGEPPEVVEQRALVALRLLPRHAVRPGSSVTVTAQPMGASGPWRLSLHVDPHPGRGVHLGLIDAGWTLSPGDDDLHAVHTVSVSLR